MQERAAQEPAGDTAPWLRPEALRRVVGAKRGRYGYVRVEREGGILVATTDLETLARKVGITKGSPPTFAWTPQDAHVRTVYEVEELAAVVDQRSAAQARAAQRKALPSAVTAAALVAAAVVFWPEKRNHQLLILLGAIFLFPVLWSRGVEALLGARRTLRALARDPAGWRRRRAEHLRFEVWTTSRKAGASWTGVALAVVAAVLFALSLAVGGKSTFAALALVKERVAEGEVWRLFTCTLLHANYLHIYFNVLVGLALAKVARRLVSELRVLGTFLLSALAGSAASYLLTQATSVGASGGILGWGGMLAGLGLAHPVVRRTGLMSQMLRWVLLLAIIGVAGASFIDNAAHAGGFAAGFVLGVLFGRSGRHGSIPLGGDRPTTAFWVLAAVAGAAALGPVVVLLRMLFR